MKPLYLRILIPCFLVLVTSGCTTFIMSRSDPFYKSFYEKTSLIMTDDEVKEYRSLKEEARKKEFIKEFWEKRDLDPTTDENEGKLLFAERIAYCNEWFWSFSKSRGTATMDDRSKDMGWKTDRGRIYIVLGPPDYINYNGSARWDTERYVGALRTATEVWYYSRFELTVIFDRGRLLNYRMAELLSAMDEAKLEWINPGSYQDPEKMMQYEAEFSDGQIRLSVFPGNIAYKAQESRLLLKLKISLEIFSEQQLIDSLEKTETLELTEAEVLEIDHFEFSIPYRPAEPGKYTVNIVIRDLYSMSGATSKKTFRFIYK